MGGGDGIEERWRMKREKEEFEICQGSSLKGHNF